jgi:hypothetical protein
MDILLDKCTIIVVVLIIPRKNNEYYIHLQI